MRSPLTHAGASALPVMIAIAEFEYPLRDLFGLELAHRIAIAHRHAPRFMRLAGHNHISMVAHFNIVEDSLGREIVDSRAAWSETRSADVESPRG
jgi:acetyl esterase